MSFLKTSILLLSVAIAGFAAWLVPQLPTTRLPPPVPNPDPELADLAFRQVQPNLWLCNFTFYTWPLEGAPVTVFMIKEGSSWVMVDAGARDVDKPGFISAFMGAVKALTTTEGGSLKLLLLTHGHWDHVGALPALLAEYPALEVGMHIGEQPFMVGRAAYKDLPSNGWYKVMQNFWGPSGIKVPSGKAFFVEGLEGDFAAMKNDKGKPSWAPPKGALKFFHAPGHAPGQVAILHTASKTLLGGDVVEILPDGTIVTCWQVFTPDKAAEAVSVKRVCSTPGWSLMYPSHDFPGVGVSSAVLKDYAKTL